MFIIHSNKHQEQIHKWPITSKEEAMPYVSMMAKLIGPMDTISIVNDKQERIVWRQGVLVRDDTKKK